MTLQEGVLGCLFAGLMAYAIFGGADFGAGIWDLLAGSADRGMRQRNLIEHSIAPVWEANHVWLIFVLVVLWTGFPPAFAAVASTLYIPLTLAAFGMIARGSAFAFRKSVESFTAKRQFGILFASSSLITPYFLGSVVGAVASGRVPRGIAQGDVISSWVNPTAVLGGVLSVGTCAYLAAVFLCGEARREQEDGQLADQFRARAIGTAAVVGAVAVGGAVVLKADAPLLFDGLLGRAFPIMLISGLGGLSSILLLLGRRYVAARLSATVAVAAVLGGWATAQYPYVLIPDLTIEQAAASPTTLRSLLLVLLVGSALLVPALVFMYRLFQQAEPQHSHSEVRQSR